MEAAPLQVVATHAITGEFARKVGGDFVQVETLAGAGGDPHHFEPSPAHMSQVAKARVIFQIGLNYEPWLPGLVKASQSRAKLVPLSRGLKLLKPGETWPLESVLPPCCATGLDKPAKPSASAPIPPAVTPAPSPAAKVPASGHAEGPEHANCPDCASATHDPHLWLDVRHAMSMALAIADVLADLDPAHADVFLANASAYVAELRKLDEWAADEIMGIPVKRRYLVTEHYSFGYFARRYGLAIEGTVYPASSTEGAEPGPRHLVDLASAIRSRGLPVIFSDSTPASPLVAKVAQQAGVRTAALQAENLSASLPTYEALIRHNVNAIVTGLSAD